MIELVSVSPTYEPVSYQNVYARFDPKAEKNKFRVVFPYYIFRCKNQSGKVGDLFVGMGRFEGLPKELLAVGWRPFDHRERRDIDYLYRNLGLVVFLPKKSLEELSEGDVILTCPKDRPMKQFFLWSTFS